MESIISNTERRHLVAARRIPEYVSCLLEKQTLTERDVELLYGEYRAYHKGRRPFCSQIERVSVVTVWDDESDTELLARLLHPSQISRQKALAILYGLWASVSVRDQQLVNA